jgi:hypothetical protein
MACPPAEFHENLLVGSKYISGSKQTERQSRDFIKLLLILLKESRLIRGVTTNYFQYY